MYLSIVLSIPQKNLTKRSKNTELADLVKNKIYVNLKSFGHDCKKYRLKVESLEKEIKHLEREHLTSQSNDVQQKQLEYSTLTILKTENAIRWIRHRFYKQDDKVGKLFARQIRREEARREIHIMKSGPNTITNPQEINIQFNSIQFNLFI